MVPGVAFAVEEFRRGLHESGSLATILPVVCPAFVISDTNIHDVCLIFIVPFQTPHEASDKIRGEILGPSTKSMVSKNNSGKTY